MIYKAFFVAAILVMSRYSRAASFLLALLTGAVGCAVAMVIADEIPMETEKVSACIRHIETKSTKLHRLSHRRLSLYLVLSTDGFRHKFVHNLGMMWLDEELREKIRVGDCVTITVDAALIQPPSPTISHSLESLDSPNSLEFGEVLGLVNSILSSRTSRWIRMIRLELGQEELISPLDALGWTIARLGAFALFSFGLCVLHLRRFTMQEPQ